MPQFVRLSSAPARRRSHKRRNPMYGKYRPTLRYTGKGWRRPRNKAGKVTSRLFPKPVRLNRPFTRRTARLAARKRWGLTRRNPVRTYRRKRRHNAFATLSNPRRVRRHRRANPVRRMNRRHYRHNPKLLSSLMNKKVLMTGLSIGGGLIVGGGLMPLVNQLIPKDKTTGKSMIDRKYMGIIHVALGGLMYAFLKNKMLKDMGLVIAGTGVYDLAVQNIDYLRTDLGLPALPDGSKVVTDAFAKSGTAVSASYGIARAPMSHVAASYQRGYGASYQRAVPQAGLSGSHGSESPYSEIEF